MNENAHKDAPESAPADAADADIAHPDDLRLQREIARAMENAAIHGLCREGQEEIAAGLVKTARPDWPDGTVLAFVRHVMAQV